MTEIWPGKIFVYTRANLICGCIFRDFRRKNSIDRYSTFIEAQVEKVNFH